MAALGGFRKVKNCYKKSRSGGRKRTRKGRKSKRRCKFGVNKRTGNCLKHKRSRKR